MSERLHKAIAKSGITSRRKAEELIKAGKVLVNGKRITEMGFLVSPNDTITVNGKVAEKEQKVYYLLNKPKQVLSSVSDDRGRRVVTDLIPEKSRIYPVGRLDYDTTGLIILTNDGDFANKLIHPRHHLPKTYHVKVKGLLNEDSVKLIRSGLKTKDELYQPALVSDVKPDRAKFVTHFTLTIYEGKNRQIRLMMEYLGHEVLALSRLSLGPLKLDNLRSGEYRELKPHEVKLLLKASSSND